MKVKANKGFSGFFSTGKPFNMHAGEVREVEDSGTVHELISIGRRLTLLRRRRSRTLPNLRQKRRTPPSLTR